MEGTCRVIYTAKFREVVYVLDAFQKKSKRSIATPKQGIDLSESQLKRPREHYKKYSKQRNGGE